MASMLAAADGEVMSYNKIYATLDQRFNEIISDLSNPSTSKEKRSKAESEFKFCKENGLNTVVDKLVYLLGHSPDIDVRKMSATLLGDIFEKSKSTQSRVVDELVKLLVHSPDIDVREMSAILLGNIFKKSKSKSQSREKISCLLDCVVKEENRPIIEVLGDTISKLAPDEIVANTLLEGLARDNTSLQECTLLIFPQLVQYVFDSKVLYMDHLHRVFESCLKNLGSANVRIAALIAATSFIQCLVTHGDKFQDLLPDMMQCLDEVLNGGDEAMKQKALALLIKLAETNPSYFRGQLVELVKSMLQIADTLEEGTRNLAIKFVITLVEYVINCEIVSYIMPLHCVFKSCLENVGVGSANVRIAALIAATSFIQCLKSDVDSFQDLLPRMMQCLVEVLNGGDEAMKQKALVLLIKLAKTKPSFFRGQLVEVVGSMLQIADRLEERTRNLAIKFVITLVEYVINCKLVSYIMPLHDVFKSCLENVGVGSANVRIAALIAATSFIQWLMIDGDSFQDLLPRMMQCLVESFNGGDKAMTQKALVLLIELAETRPRFFKGQLEEVVWSMLQIAEAESLEKGTRDLAIEFVIMLEEVSNRGPAHIHVRAMSAFLLGNLFKQCHSMSELTQSRVKEYLQDCVVNEENKPIIEILGYSISMLAPDEEVAYFIVDRVASLQESALLVFPHVLQYVMACDVPFTIRLRYVFKNHLENVGSANVRIVALIAVTSFIQCLISSSDGDWFEDWLPGMMQCLDESVNGGDEAMTQKALVLLIEFAETNPSFFTEHLVEVVGSMSQIADTESLEEGTRNLAIKFLITLNEAHDVSALVNISDNFPPDTSMPDMLEIVGNLRQFRLQEGIASDQTRTLAIEKHLKQFREQLPPKTWASTWSSLRLESILAHKEN